MRGSEMRVERLEQRHMLSTAYPTDLEQYVVELINRARANPAAEAARFGIDLNEGLPAGTLSTSARQPLAINPLLLDAARKHSQWMIDKDTFSHSGSGGSDPGKRIRDAGYNLVAPWTWGENIALSSGSIRDIEKAFMHSPEHRANILDPCFKHVAIGVVRDDNGTAWVTVFFYG